MSLAPGTKLGPYEIVSARCWRNERSLSCHAFLSLLFSEHHLDTDIPRIARILRRCVISRGVRPRSFKPLHKICDFDLMFDTHIRDGHLHKAEPFFDAFHPFVLTQCRQALCEGLEQ